MSEEYRDNQRKKLIKNADQVKKVFWSILEVGSTKLISKGPSIWNGPEATDYETEKKIIHTCCRPFMYGMAGTCLIFLSFRISANRTYQLWRQRHFNIPTSYKSSPKPKQQEWKSYSQLQMEKQKEKMAEFSSLPTDFLLSIMLGISITGFSINTSTWKKGFVAAPLLPGKSLSSKYLCHDMTALFNRVDPSVWKNRDDDVLDALHLFADNCRKRNELEQRIRQEQNLLKEQDISFPDQFWIEFLENEEKNKKYVQEGI